jgi:2-polyprenyl-6-hydroxyphenyl methylase / 3-demethylubiquinone-9 3-methyltransferase
MTTSPRPKSQKPSFSPSVDAGEISHFAKQSAGWWDEDGPFAPLHRMNPVRIGFIRDQVQTLLGRGLAGLDLLDVGCGGGLLTEPLARIGARVTGLDAGADTIAAAETHATQMGLKIHYQANTVEDLAATKARFTIVTALEVAEHVADLPSFLDHLCALVKPDGLLFMSTLNRTAKSYLGGILMAEHLLNWAEPGTHSWHKFIRPAELVTALEARGFIIEDLQGMPYGLLSGAFSLSPTDLDVNYILVARKGQILA